MSKNISPSKSFEGWQLVEFLKGQKKTVIAAIGWVLGFILSNDEVIATGSAFIFAGLVAVGEYYFKQVDNRK